MTIGYMLLGDNLWGGNVRALQIAKRLYQKGEVRFFAPADRMQRLRKQVEKLEPGLSIAINRIEPIEVGSYDLGGALGHLRFMLKFIKSVNEQLGRTGFLYLSHEYFYGLLALKLSRVRWAALLQEIPAVYNLVTPYSGPMDLARNYQLIFDRVLSGAGLFKAYSKVLGLRWILNRRPVLAVSKSISEDLRALGIRGECRTTWPPNAAEECVNAKGKQRDLDILFCTRLTVEKGVFDFLEVVRLLKARVPGLSASMAGFVSPAAKGYISGEAERLGVKVHFDLPSDELVRLRSRAKLLVYPSRFDAFPLALLESLKCGTPAIAYDIPAIRYNYPEDVVSRVKFRDTAAMAEAAERLLGSPDKLADMRDAALKFAKGFTWDAVAEAEYGELLRLANS